MDDSTYLMGVARPAILEAGLFSVESLFVQFAFSFDALIAAGERYLESLRSADPVEMPSEVKTYVHELTHYLQYTTTPYGLFLQHCRQLQSNVTIDIVKTLLDAGFIFNLPLLDNLPVLTGDLATYVNCGLGCWINIENLLAMFHRDDNLRWELTKRFIADSDRVEAGQPPKLPPLLPINETFAKVQDSMAVAIEQTNANALAAGNSVPIYPEGFDHEAIRQEYAETQKIDRKLMAKLGFETSESTLGNPWNLQAVIESAATAAEFWGSTISYEEFSDWVKANVNDQKWQVYLICIEQGLGAIRTKVLSEFIPSYMALCELALYSPVLPQHAELRREHRDFNQILPTNRWLDLIRAACHVQPMRGIYDCARYVSDIIKYLGWVHPVQIIKVAIEGSDNFSEPLNHIYLWAQRMRAQHMGSFLGVHRFLFDPSPAADSWRAMFNFVILDYADRTYYHTDKSFLQAITTHHLNMIALRCIMRGKSLTIAAPYRGNPAEKKWMTTWLRDRFKTLFGRDFPMLQVV